jgi:phage portal protein BeeE
MSVDALAQMIETQLGGSTYSRPVLQQTMAGEATESAGSSFESLAQNAYAANGVVFACMMVRQLVFSSVRFSYQRMRVGRPSDLFGTADLRILERPWNGGTTQDMLSRMIQDADLAGNSYWVRDGDELVRLRPDWVQIVGRERYIGGRAAGRPTAASRGGQVGWEKVGYLYHEGGIGNDRPAAFLASEVVHFAPIPDPLARFTGMSWLTPILREIRADEAMTRHQRKFFDNAASPNMVIKHDPGAALDAIKKFDSLLKENHAGADNAWKTLNLYPGADVTVVGANLKDIDFKNVRGGGETRIAAAAGVPPVIVGLSEGLAAATYSNYGQARRRLADGTAHPLWQNIASCLEHAVKLPGEDARLWYDASDVPFLREDEKDAAEIQKVRAETISNLITAGYVPDSVVAAVDANDMRLLVHSGLMSVQLQAPGTPPGDSPTIGDPNE